MSLLEEMKKKHKIPECPFEAVYDRICVYLVPEAKAKRKTFIEGGVIEMTDTEQSDEQRKSPRGVVVSAGLEALDILRSHKMDVGHMVWIARLSPWRYEVEHTSEGVVEFMFLRVGDVVGSETLLENIKAGKLKLAEGSDGRLRYEEASGNGKSKPASKRVDPPSYVA